MGKTCILCILYLLLSLETHGQPNFSENFSDTLHPSRLKRLILTESAFYTAGIGFLNFIWYRDHERVAFHFYNDLEGYLQMDKAGHGFGAYYQSYQGYYGARWAGLDHQKALIYGAPLGILFQTPIEIFDGMYEGYGFSWWDTWANVAGTAIFTIQQAIWEQQFLMMKFSYSPSGYPKYHDTLGETQLESLFLDYNGQTYWFSGNIKDITGWDHIPPWLNLAIGYSANGMIHEFDNPTSYKGEPFPHLPRYRQFLFSLDLDLSKIQARRPWVRSLLKHLNFIKIPFPALEINRMDGLRFRPLYF